MRSLEQLIASQKDRGATSYELERLTGQPWSKLERKVRLLQADKRVRIHGERDGQPVYVHKSYEPKYRAADLRSELQEQEIAQKQWESK